MVWWFPVVLIPDPDGDFSLPARRHSSRRRYSTYSSDDFFADGRPPPRYRGRIAPQYARYYIEEDAYLSDYDVEERSPSHHRRFPPSRRPRRLSGGTLYSLPSPEPYLSIPPPEPYLTIPRPDPYLTLPTPAPRPRRVSITSSSSGEAMPPHVPDPPPRPVTPVGSTLAHAGSAVENIVPRVTPGLSSYTGSGSSRSSRRRHRSSRRRQNH